MTGRASNKEIPKIDARHLSVDGQKDLRARGMKMIEAGVPQRTIATNLGICRSTVFKWSKLLKEKSFGEAINAHKRGPTEAGKERQSALTYAQQEVIRKKIIDKTPSQLRFDFALWTLAAIQELILRMYQVKISRTTLSKYLKRWGFTVQRPAKSAVEQDPVKVSQWLYETYPAIAAEAKKQNAEIYWADETSIQQDANWARGFSPVGQTPKLRLHGSHLHGAPVMISAVQNQGKLHFKIQKKAVNAQDYLLFLQELVDDNKGRKIFVIADNARIHHARLVKDWVDQNKDRIELYFLPPYSPEHNPDEYLNRHVKTKLRGSRPMTHQQSQSTILEYMEHLVAKGADLVKRLFDYPLVRYASNRNFFPLALLSY